MDKEEKFRIYDSYINSTLINIYSLAKKDKMIILSGFDGTDENHLFILSVALLANQITGYPIYLKGNIINYLKNKALLGKNKKRVKRLTKKNYEKWTISVKNLLVHEENLAKEKLGKDFTLAEIYKEYFERDYKNGK